MKVTIIDYGLGNLTSIAAAVKKIGHKPIITNNNYDVLQSEKIILPGVGAFPDAMRNLKKLNLIDALEHIVKVKQIPILGICLGFHLFARESSEFGNHKGLGWIDAKVEKLETKKNIIRVPHIGWNDLIQTRSISLWEDIPDHEVFYYVHSYHVNCQDKKIITGTCNHGIKFVSAIHQKNIYATQFHPEKSQLYGLKVLKNFIEKT